MRDVLYTIAIVSLTYLPLALIAFNSAAIATAYGLLGLALATIAAGLVGSCIFVSLFKLTKGNLA